jgi:hypothetical protein
MYALFAVLLIALALVSVVAVMAVVLREKRPHDAGAHYVRSPWNDPVTHDEGGHPVPTDVGPPPAPAAVPEPDASTGTEHTPLSDPDDTQ